jgi:hypothetical protein
VPDGGDEPRPKRVKYGTRYPDRWLIAVNNQRVKYSSAKVQLEKIIGDL